MLIVALSIPTSEIMLPGNEYEDHFPIRLYRDVRSRGDFATNSN